jgi:CheY-like chemotaxis protein
MPEAKRVLLVDDDTDLRSTVAQLLRDHGWAVEDCPDGRAAMERLRDSARPAPDLVLLDLMMPVMNGWQFLDERRQDRVLAAIPVVLMTASRTEVDSASEISAWVRKPFGVGQLLDVVTKLIGPPE